MAKRRTQNEARRAKKKFEMAEARNAPGRMQEGSGKSHYALKRKGQREPGPAQSRPSWFVRERGRIGDVAVAGCPHCVAEEWWTG